MPNCIRASVADSWSVLVLEHALVLELVLVLVLVQVFVLEHVPSGRAARATRSVGGDATPAARRARSP
ncbi:hypothetical protein NS263_06220 [Curtobacterium oceanosedimentum]|uniref:Uncharacterized protein n=1 Tax=Curtobacterium oceanosedimentum TaxID=465820 RepID=A0ABR5S7C9_9MICO|nr:hypothetical protein NS263_06220 [Curtobacterium oceanosedimentum]